MSAVAERPGTGAAVGPERVRALVLTPDFPPAFGGIQLLMHRLVTHMEGVDAAVVTLGEPAAVDRGLDVRRVREGRVRQATVARLGLRGVREAIRRRPAVIVAGHVVTAPAALAARRLTGAPVVQYLHADEFRGRPALCRLAVRHANAVIAVSRYTRGLALDAGAARGRLHLIHPGVDLPDAAPAVRAARPTLVTVARLTAHKGHDVVLQALPEVRASVPDVEWLVVGDGPERGRLEALAARLGVADAVHFVGAVDEAERDAALDRAHAFVMPSRVPAEGVGGEGFGIAYAEAAARGLPAVAGDRGGAVDAVIDGETGLLCDANDPAAVAGAIIRLLTDPDFAGALAANARRRAEALAWPRIAASVEDVLRGLVA